MPKTHIIPVLSASELLNWLYTIFRNDSVFLNFPIILKNRNLEPLLYTI